MNVITALYFVEFVLVTIGIIFTLVAILNVIISYIMQNFEYYPYITAGRNMPNMLKF